MDEQREIFAALQPVWELQQLHEISEQEILHALSRRIALLMERSTEQFFQLMYRLDIPEQKLLGLMTDIDAPATIAALVYQRQLQKLRSRQQHVKKPGEDPDLQW